MPKIKFSNILLERNSSSSEYPSLYCKSSCTWFDSSDGSYSLVGSGEYDFTTYFNALSVQKLKRYADAKAFELHLEVCGSDFEIVQTYADVLAASPIDMPDTSKRFGASSDWFCVDIDLVALDSAVLVGFKLNTEGDLSIRNCYYSVSIDHDLHDVNLLLSTTTFKKEDYIKRNIKLVDREILQSSDYIADHFNMLVVDNGRTLDCGSLSTDCIKVIPNQNVGGAGGFTRGMIYALDADDTYSNILLMDDDVLVSPESIKRCFNLLRIVNDEYHEAFISGAMLASDAGDVQWEDTGFMNEVGACRAAKPVLTLTKFEDVVFNEAFRVSGEAAKSHQRYAAWWFCCIPLSIIKKNDLPLPYFVRCDDAEYGTRCNPKFMTMNGICIWHDSFHRRYNAAVERYNMTRNVLIARYTTGFAPHSEFVPEIRKSFYLELKKFSYENAELILIALEDFLKGPDYYSKKGIAERTFMEANRNKEKMYPLKELPELAKKNGLNGFDLSSIDRQLIDGDRPRSFWEHIEDFATNNQQKLVVTEGKGFAVIPNTGWAYPAGVIRGKKYLVVIDWYNRLGTIRKKDAKRYKALDKRFKKDIAELKSRNEELHEQYQSSRSKVTSLPFWREYLDLDV